MAQTTLLAAVNIKQEYWVCTPKSPIDWYNHSTTRVGGKKQQRRAAACPAFVLLPAAHRLLPTKSIYR